MKFVALVANLNVFVKQVMNSCLFKIVKTINLNLVVNIFIKVSHAFLDVKVLLL